jgi:hypothetical protein
VQLPPPWNDPGYLIFPQLNIVCKALKTAICLPQIAVFCLTKYLFIQHFSTINHLSLPKKFIEADKPGFSALLLYSSGCRSPPSNSGFSKNSGFGGNEHDKSY